MSFALEINNVSYSYDQEKWALNKVSFSVEEGQYVCLLGHNGSGKSTLAKILVGLLGDYEGSYSLFGTPITKKNLVSLRSKIGIVFQNPDNQFVGSTVADDIAFGLENHAIPQKEMQGIIDEFVKAVGMEDYLDYEPSSLSGGQKQRVALAGVLAMQPSLLVLDEATAMLDPKAKREIDGFISKLRKQNPSLTIFSITHDLEEASHADEIIVLNDGKVLLSGTPASVFSYEEELKEAHLDLPFFYQLLSSLRKEGVDVPSEINSLEKLKEFLCQ